MTVTKGVGRSRMTPDKLRGFARFLELHAGIVRYVGKNGERKWGTKPGPYYYVDTHCGTGDNEDYGPGSPVIFLDTMRRLGMDYRAFFIDLNVGQLRERIGRDTRVTIYEQDNRDAIDDVVAQLPAKALGMLYMDPNGSPTPWIQLLMTVAEKRHRLDILVRANTTAVKRDPSPLRFADIPAKVAKEHWLIRGPAPGDGWRWTFLLGANFQLGDWKNERFYKLGSHEGRDIMRRLNFTDDELREIVQPRLFMREAAAERSGGVCEVCGFMAATEMHHLSYGPDLDPVKLLHVCHRCHCLLEGKES